jgi:hypothetical protein
MNHLTPYACGLATGLLFVSGCAYFRPSQTEAERLQEQQIVREQQYLSGTFVDGLVKTAGTAAANAVNH